MIWTLGKMALVLAELVLLLGALKLPQRTTRAHPELVRKLLHVAMGVTVLSFPWLFDSLWPVLVLCGVATLGLLALRIVPALVNSIGSVISGVGRASFGEVYYPIAVGALWVLSDGDLLLFGVPMLVLTLADALAALIGMRYGSVHYQTYEGHKSAEGSVAFFAVAFLSVHVPVLLLSDVGRAESLLLAVIVGLLVMLLESIAWRGLDNLFVPLGTYAFLQMYLDASAESLAWRSGVALGLVCFTLLWRRRSSMDDSALIAGSLFGYVALMLGGWHWLIAPLSVFVVHNMLWPRGAAARSHSVGAVLSIIAAGLLCLLLQAHQPWTGWFWAYTASFAAHLAIVSVSYLLWEPPRTALARAGRCAIAIAIGWGLVFVPVVAFLITPTDWRGTFTVGLIMLLTTAIAAMGFERLMPWLYHTPVSTYRVHSIGAGLALAASVLTGGAVYALS